MPRKCTCFPVCIILILTISQRENDRNQSVENPRAPVLTTRHEQRPDINIPLGKFAEVKRQARGRGNIEAKITRTFNMQIPGTKRWQNTGVGSRASPRRATPGQTITWPGRGREDREWEPHPPVKTAMLRCRSVADVSCPSSKIATARGHDEAAEAGNRGLLARIERSAIKDSSRRLTGSRCT